MVTYIYIWLREIKLYKLPVNVKIFSYISNVYVNGISASASDSLY